MAYAKLVAAYKRQNLINHWIRLGFAALFIIAGISHFVITDWFAKAIGFMFHRREIILISGLVEIALGIVLLFRRYQYYAAWFVIIMLIGYLPGHVYVAIKVYEEMEVSQWMAWARIPFQFVMIGLALRLTR